jgi:uncharacterized protein
VTAGHAASARAPPTAPRTVGEDASVATFGVLLVELLALLLLVSSGLALAVRRVGATRLQAWLGGGRTRGAVKGTALGSLVPFCTYSAVPLLVGMIDVRARTSTIAGFLLAAPLLDPVVVAVLWLLFGGPATVAYTLVAVATVLLLALAADAAGLGRFLLAPTRAGVTAEAVVSDGTGVTSEAAVSERAGAGCDPDPYRDPRPWAGLRAELPDAGRYAVSLLRSLALPMVVAVAIAAAIVGFVPADLVARVAGPDDPFAVPLAALVGVPFYVSTEAFLPIAAALHERGMGLGAVFALVITAAGVNVPEVALLGRLLRPLLLAGYVAAVLAVAVTAGYLVPLLV